MIGVLRSFPVLAIVAAIAAAAPAEAARRGFTAALPKVRQGAAIEAALAEGKTTRVIVTLATGTSSETWNARLAAPTTRAEAVKEAGARIDTTVMRHFGPVAKVNGAPVVRMTTSPSFATELGRDQLRRLAADPAVVRITPDLRATTQLDVTTVTIGMPAAWARRATGAWRALAVIDTGAETTHPFLGAFRVAAEGCFLTTPSCPNGRDEQTGRGAGAPTSGLSHGTHVSGIAVGKRKTDQGTPAAGVAKYANLVVINVFEKTGYTYSSSMIRALEYVEELSIRNPTWFLRAVNMSIGGWTLYGDYCDDVDPEMKAVIDRLRRRDVATVIAAGNGYATNAMNWPGCLSSAVSVGATDRLGDTVAYYGNVAAGTRLLAPGGDFYNGDGVYSSVIGGGFEAYQGTSMAAPHVAGAIVALSSRFAGRGVSEIEDALRRTGATVRDDRVGNGFAVPRIDVAAAAAFLAAPKAPANDRFARAIALTPNRSYWGSTSGATGESGEPGPTLGDRRSIWYRLSLDETRRVTLDTRGSNFDTVLTVYRGVSLSALTAVAANDDAARGEGWSRISFDARAGVPYHVAVVPKVGTPPGTVRLTVTAPPANDAFAAARVVTVSSGAVTTVTGGNVGATLEPGEPTTHGTSSVWWRFTAPATGTYTIDTFGSTSSTGDTLDTMLGVYVGGKVSALRLVAANDDTDWSYASSLTLRATRGTTYHIAVGAALPEATGTIRLQFTPPGVTPPSPAPQTRTSRAK